MTEVLPMSNREIDRLRIIDKVLTHHLSWRQAAEELSLSKRHIGRLCCRFRQEGPPGLIHGLRGKPSNHHLDPGVLDKALDIIKGRYHDFGPSFANEKLLKLHKIKMSTPTLRKGMIQAGLWTPRKAKPKHRAWRQRRPRIGMLIQLDGSIHDWFEGRGQKCVLVIFIDDATSRILSGQFVSSEDTLNLMHAAKAYLLAHGRPLGFYVDKDSIYFINRQATIEEDLRDLHPLTQFTRAMQELGVEMIPAHSPQAKGRVERSFRTHQDRLVKELRLAGISTIEQANKFLQEVYIPEHNANYAVSPQEQANAHRPLLPTHKLEEILSLRTERTLSQDFCLRFQNRFFQVLPDQTLTVRPKDKIWVEIRLDGSFHLRFKDHYLNFKELANRPYRAYYAQDRGMSEYLPIFLGASNQKCVRLTELQTLDTAAPDQERPGFELFPIARFGPLAKIRKAAHRDAVLGTR